jgi:hypothetical protein
MASNINFKQNSYRGATAVTPSDTVSLADPVSALYIGTTGALSVLMENGETVVFVAVPVGVLEIAVVRVNSTGTVASNIVGLK